MEPLQHQLKEGAIHLRDTKILGHAHRGPNDDSPELQYERLKVRDRDGVVTIRIVRQAKVRCRALAFPRVLVLLLRRIEDSLVHSDFGATSLNEGPRSLTLFIPRELARSAQEACVLLSVVGV